MFFIYNERGREQLFINTLSSLFFVMPQLLDFVFRLILKVAFTSLLNLASLFVFVKSTYQKRQSDCSLKRQHLEETINKR